jgi:O-antigen/teichoic acid export membrane protein
MSVRSAALWSMGAQYLTFIIQFVVSVIVSRFFLGPEEVGLFSIALGAAMMISIFQDFGITRYISGRPSLEPEAIRNCATVSLYFSWGIAALVLALTWPIAALYDDMRLVPLIATIAASYLFVPMSTVPAAVLTRDLDFKGLFAVNAGSAFVGGVATLGFAASGLSAASLACGALVQAFTRGLIAQKFRPVRPRLVIARADASPILGFGSANTLLAISAAIGMRSQDLVVGRLISIYAAGLFSRATALAGQLSMLVTGAINGVFYPAFARLRERGEPLGQPYVRLVTSVTAINWAAMAGLACAAEPLVLTLYGERWQEASDLLRWTALAEMFFVALPLHIDMPVLMGRMKTLLWVNFTDTTIAIGFLVIGSLIGIEAAALARLAYGIGWWMIYARFQKQLLGFSWASLFAGYGRSAIAALAAILPMLAAYRWWRAPAELGLDGMMVTASLGVVCWYFTLQIVRHPAAAEITLTSEHLMARLRAIGRF